MPYGMSAEGHNHNPGVDKPEAPAAGESGVEFKAALRAGTPKFGIFLNSASPTVAEQFSHAGYDWLLVDCQHGPMEPITMSAMLCAISSGGAKSMVRVAGYDDRSGIQQALDLGADGILIPYINNAQEAKDGVSCCLYPFGKAGTRSVYFPQRSMNKAGLLGYAGSANDHVIIALQVETEDCIKNMEAICNVPRVDMLFLGQNDLCVSMGLFDGKYEFPAMYTSPELQAATEKLIKCAKAKDILLGMFQFGTDRVTEFLDKDFNFISVGNDLHHCLTQNFAHKEALVACASAASGTKAWTPRLCAMVSVMLHRVAFDVFWLTKFAHVHSLTEWEMHLTTTTPRHEITNFGPPHTVEVRCNVCFCPKLSCPVVWARLSAFLDLDRPTRPPPTCRFDDRLPSC